jgi:hypothetical protein
MDMNEGLSYDDDEDLLDDDDAELLDDVEDEAEEEPELIEVIDDEPELEEDLSLELASDNPIDDNAPVTPYCPHGLMDILLPAVPPKPANARVIRRLKD